MLLQQMSIGTTDLALPVIFCCIFINFTIVCQEGSDKQDINKFLENIKQTLKSIKNEKKLIMNNGRKNAKSQEREARKLKARKQIISRLANPLYRFKQHAVIRINNEKLTINNAKKKDNKSPNLEISKSQNPNNLQTAATIKTIEREVKSLFSFNLPDFKKFLKSKDYETSINNNKDKETDKLSPDGNADDIKNVLNWLIEYIKIPASFWSIVENILIKDKKFSDYVKKNLCEELKDVNLFADEVNADNVEGYIRLLDDPRNVINNLYDLSLFLNPINELREPTLFSKLNIDINDQSVVKKIANQSVTKKSNICSDLITIHLKGKLIMKKYVLSLIECFEKIFLKYSSNPVLDEQCKQPFLVPFLYQLVKRLSASSRSYFKNMELFIKYKIIPLYGRILYEENKSSVTPPNNETLMFLIFYDTIYYQKLLWLDNLLDALKNKPNMQTLENYYKCSYKPVIFEKIKKLTTFIYQKADNFKSVLQGNYFEVIKLINKIDGDFKLNDIVNLFSTIKNTSPYLLLIIMKSGIFQDFIKEYDEFINTLQNNIKSQESAYCSSILLGYIYSYIQLKRPELLESTSQLRAYIEGAIFYMKRKIEGSYNYDIEMINWLFSDLQYLSILNYIFYVNYYAYMFAKCIRKDSQSEGPVAVADANFIKIVEENKCIFKNQPLNCSTNPSLRLTTILLKEKADNLKLNNLGTNILGSMDKDLDIPINDDIKNLCSSIGNCEKYFDSGPGATVFRCPLIKEYKERNPGVCPNVLSNCQQAGEGTLCYIYGKSCDEKEEIPMYCLSSEKCRNNEFCKKLYDNFNNFAISIFSSGTILPEEFCSLLKNEIAQCCTILGDYAIFLTKISQICTVGKYNVSKDKFVDAYNMFSNFIQKNFGSNYINYMQSRLKNLDKEPFELDDCSKVFP